MKKILMFVATSLLAGTVVSLPQTTLTKEEVATIVNKLSTTQLEALTQKIAMLDNESFTKLMSDEQSAELSWGKIGLIGLSVTIGTSASLLCLFAFIHKLMCDSLENKTGHIKIDSSLSEKFFGCEESAAQWARQILASLIGNII